MKPPAALLFAALATATLLGAHAAPDADCDTRGGRAFIPAGLVLLGEDGDGRPGELKHVQSFWIDRHEVTNRQFAAFVAATGYRTRAEREGKAAVFVAPTEPVALDNAVRWWRMIEGAEWRHPQGAGSDVRDRPNEPVVHVDREDAQAYARWAGGSLPTLEQWERAARGEQNESREPGSWAFAKDGKARANVWEGIFPIRNTGDDGHVGIAPVGCFPANSFGLYDMVGNAWEWVAGEGPTGLIKGGSYLCSRNYCANFRPAAFQAQEQDFGASHIGFRVVYSNQRSIVSTRQTMGRN